MCPSTLQESPGTREGDWGGDSRQNMNRLLCTSPKHVLYSAVKSLEARSKESRCNGVSAVL